MDIKENLYNVAKKYVEVIDQMERATDRQQLADLEEERACWHNKMLAILKREGIPFRDREHVTRLAYYLVRECQ